MEYTKKQMDVLRCLLLGNKRFMDLKEALNYKHDMTLNRQLKALEIKEYICHDHIRKIYKITSKGLVLLNELDMETKGRIFTAHVFGDIDNIFVEGNILPHDRDEMPEDRIREDFDNLSKLIGQAMIYTALKWSENKEKLFILNLLDNLPKLLAERSEKNNYHLKRFKKYLVTKNFDEYYKYTENITAERYKEITEFYRDFVFGPEFCKLVGLQIKEKEEKLKKNGK